MNLNIDLDLLLTFKQIIAHGSFKNAAQRLHRTQSAISMQMKRLEEHVGHKLLERNSRGMQLTAVGAVVLRYAERLQTLQDSLGHELSGFGLEGELRLGIPADYVTDALSGILPFLKQDYPGVQLIVESDMSRALRRRLENGELDMALLTAEEGDRQASILWRDPLQWFVASGTEPAPDDEIKIALFDGDCVMQDMMLSDLEKSGRHFQIVLRSPHMPSLVTAVETGFAASLLPEPMGNRPRLAPLKLGRGLGKRHWSVHLEASPGFLQSPLGSLFGIIQDLYRQPQQADARYEMTAQTRKAS